MNCTEWQLDVSAYLDGSLDPDKQSAIEQHLADCPGCASFYSECVELNEVFRAALPEQELPPSIWHNLEAQLAPTPTVVTDSRSWDFRNLFRMPQLGYAGALFVLVLMVGFFLLNTPGTGSDDQRYLAELESFSIEVEGNPFLSEISAENPFLKLGPFDVENPFERLGGRLQ